MPPKPRPRRGVTALETLVRRWLRRYGAVALRAEMRRHGYVAKAGPSEDTLMAELRALLLRYGLRSARSAANRAGEAVGADIVIPESFVRDALAGREVPLKWIERLVRDTERRVDDIAEETRALIRQTVSAVIRDANAETPKPSSSEVARRIRTTTLATDSRGVYALSSERAIVVAQTELAIAENTGAFESYREAGVTEVEWLARTDGRSGSRHHERMHGKRVRVGERFTLPSGARLRFPGDPRGPVGEIVNCRCAVAPVMTARRKAG